MARLLQAAVALPLHSDTHLAALPTEHTVVFLLRLLPETPREAFALWQVTAEDFQPVLGVLLDGQLGAQAAPRGLAAPRPGLTPPSLPSRQEVADLLQPPPQGGLAGGDLRPARSEEDILRELP